MSSDSWIHVSLAFILVIAQILYLWPWSVIGAWSCALLILLEVSAAFDAADHGILIKHLHDLVGLHGIALNRFFSFLAGRSQRVVMVKFLSSP